MNVCKIDAKDLCPGDCISCDQLETNTPCMIPTWKRIPTTKTYKSATMFVDHAIHFISLSLCQSTGGDKALEAKLKFERLAKESGVIIHKFRSDNRVFTSNKFKQSLEAAGQEIMFCRVNAHFQNGIAECSICTIVDRAQTMLLHAIYKWPDEITIDVWPFTL